MTTSTDTPVVPVKLRCEYLTNPLGIEDARPRLSWEMRDPRRGARQTAYRVLVASDSDALNDDTGDLWDSGKVECDQSIHVEYAGGALASRQRCWWKVMLWDANGEPSVWGEPAFWEMGLLERSEWVGQWIGLPPRESEDSEPCAYLREGLSVRPGVRRARVYATARGVYELHLNGTRAGDGQLTPGWTDCNVRIPYQVYDVTGLVQEGENVIGAVLGEGWYSGYLVWGGNRNVWGKDPNLLAQLEVEYEDGTTETVGSDASWKVATGPIVKSDIYNGETHDARLEMPGWAARGFDDSGWQDAHVYDDTDAALVVKRCENVRKIEELQPIELSEPKPGVYVFNFGQNMVGWVRLKVSAPQGTQITIRHAEMLNDDGTLYTENLRDAKATDEYICRGEGEEVYEPRFTFHGFQYAELTGCREKPDISAVTGVVLHSDAPPTGTFECSHEMINKLQSNIQWGQKGNFLEVPTDCPQRNERLGWTGDAQVFIRTACFNMDVAAFFTKWVTDLEDAQDEDGAFPDVAPKVTQGKGHCAWADAGVICPWTIYLCYGDTRILEANYGAMAKWVEFMEKTSDGLIRPDEGYGDWLATDAPSAGRAPTPKELIGTAYFAYCAQIMAKAAALLGKTEDAARYEELAGRVKAAFSREFITPAGRVVGSTQTGYLLTLAFDLVADELRPRAEELLLKELEKRDWHLSTGFVGTPFLAPVLTRIGRTDLAYKLLLQETYPSWFYPILQGATTMWERWNSYTRDGGFGDAGMNSFNHYAYGAIGEWLYATVAGIDVDPEQPGYKHLILRPEPGGDLTFARGELKSVYGLIRSHWRLENGQFTYEVTVPANAHATVRLPIPSAGSVTESGETLSEVEGVSDVRAQDGRTVFNLAAGSYAFVTPWPSS